MDSNKFGCQLLPRPPPASPRPSLFRLPTPRPPSPVLAPQDAPMQSDTCGSNAVRRIALRDRAFDRAPLGCPVLDAFFRGGLPCGSITEVVGESVKPLRCVQPCLNQPSLSSSPDLSASHGARKRKKPSSARVTVFQGCVTRWIDNRASSGFLGNFKTGLTPSDIMPDVLPSALPHCTGAAPFPSARPPPRRSPSRSPPLNQLPSFYCAAF